MAIQFKLQIQQYSPIFIGYLSITYMQNPEQVIKSPSDNRVYKAFKLQNQLQCLVIRDQDTNKSSAALSVGVGSFKDPLAAQGLAHYLEHMLFMGTEKYPDENDYSKFITKNCGKNNAYTSQQETNYMLQITSSQFEPALDRFAQFFISPLLKQQSAVKQIEAVHSQHQKNLQNDSWRKYQLQKHLSIQGHPYRKFSTGDKNSLTQQNLQKMLKQFYLQNYSSNIMNLVVYSNHQIQTLQTWVRQKFSQIPNKNYKKYQLESQPYDSNAFTKLFKVIPIKDTKKLTLTWILPKKTQHYRNPPGSYVSNLIGHEGKGSLLSHFMREGLATAVQSGNYDKYQCFTDFSVEVTLTDKGLTKIHDIIGNFLHYIQMIKQNDLPQWFFQELKCVYKLKFQFMDKKKGMQHAASIAKNMHERKIHQVIVHPYLMQQWKPELIKQYLSQMKNQNLMVFCDAKQFHSQCTLQQPIYKTKYSRQQLTALKPLPCNVSLPEPNIFLPKDLSVLPLQPQKLPQLIYQSAYIDTFFKQDHRFGLPKANINLRFMFNGNFSVKEDIGRNVLMDMIKEELREFRYLAEMAEIDVETSFVSYFSMDVKVKGFRDSLKLFVFEYLKRLFQYVPKDQELFKTIVEKHKRKYANFFLSDPFRLAYQKCSQSIKTNSSTSDEQKLVQIYKLTFGQVIQISKSWKKNIFCQCFFSGNISQADSLTITQQIQSFLESQSSALKKSLTGQIRPIRLQPHHTSIIQLKLKNKQQANSAVQVHFQIGELSVQHEVLLNLVELVAKEPAFDYLRTQEQLGYVVFLIAVDNRGVGGLSIIVQSSVKSSHQVAGYIDTYVKVKLPQIIQKLTEQQFQSIKSALKATKLQKDKNLSQQTTRFWTQIVKHRYIFNRRQLQIEAIEQLTLSDLKKFFNQKILGDSCRHELHMICQKQEQENSLTRGKRKESEKPTIYEDIQSFARKSLLYPDFYAPNPR